MPADFLFSHSLPLPGAYLGKNGPLWPTSNTQKMTENGPIWAKNGKKRTAENFGTTYLDPKSKNNCTLFSSIFQNFAPFPRYGRLKSKFLCERYSHCIYSSCSIELTKTRNTWSLTAVLFVKINLKWHWIFVRSALKQYLLFSIFKGKLQTGVVVVWEVKKLTSLKLPTHREASPSHNQSSLVLVSYLSNQKLKSK